VRARLLLSLVAGVVIAGPAGPAAEQQYDWLLKGGHVIDPKNGRDGVMDVAISGRTIARVDPNIPASSARATIDVSGYYVTPGLVDLHTHVYAGTGAMDSFAGDSSIYPDSFAPRAGVTTVVDVGSSGWKNFPDFKWRVIDRSLTRVLAMLNVVGSGMGPGETEQTTADMDPEATAKVARQFADIIVGVKSAHYMRNDWTSVDRAVAAGRLAGIPVMVDFGASTPERSFEDLVLTHLRPGDIVTHMYVRRYPTLGQDGRPLPHILQARERGVKFDVGHGNTSFSWDKAIAGVKHGFWPDTISSDAHIRSTRLSMKDLPTVMSKMLAAGLPLKTIVELTTIAPAKLIKRPALGHLDVGGEADVAVFGMRKGTFGFADGSNVRVPASEKLECELTIRAGQVIWDLNGMTSTPWKGGN
jgi:dihydroorotase